MDAGSPSIQHLPLLTVLPVGIPRGYLDASIPMCLTVRCRALAVSYRFARVRVEAIHRRVPGSDDVNHASRRFHYLAADLKKFQAVVASALQYQAIVLQSCDCVRLHILYSSRPRPRRFAICECTPAVNTHGTFDSGLHRRERMITIYTE